MYNKNARFYIKEDMIEEFKEDYEDFGFILFNNFYEKVIERSKKGSGPLVRIVVKPLENWRIYMETSASDGIGTKFDTPEIMLFIQLYTKGYIEIKNAASK